MGRVERLSQSRKRWQRLDFSFSVCLFLLTFLRATEGFQTKARFNGSQYILYQIPTIATFYDRVALNFRTDEPFGILLFGCGTQGDFIALELKRGKLRYSADLGSTIESSGRHEIIMDRHVADNKWHSVTVTRRSNSVSVTLDDLSRSVSTPGLFTRLDLDDVISVGGLDRVRHGKHSSELSAAPNYRGCLADVRFNSIDILYGAKYGLPKCESVGNIQFSCAETSDIPFGFINSRSRMLLTRFNDRSDVLSLAFRMRTFEPNNLIYAQQTSKGHLSLALFSGRMYFNLTFESLAPERTIYLASAGNLDNGDWHSIRVKVIKFENRMTLEVDGETKMYKFAPHFVLADELGKLSSGLRIGGPSITYPGFIGCLADLQLDGKEIGWSAARSFELRGIIASCNPKDLCFPNPCQNGGRCSQQNQRFTCDCRQTRYQGSRCTRSIYKRNCQELYLNGTRQSGVYNISPDNAHAFQVYCDMSNKAGPITIVNPMLRNDTRVDAVAPFQNLHYMHTVTYKPGIEAVVNLIDISKQCRQYVRYNCFASKLLDSLKRYKYEHLRGVRWASREGTLQTYWGGATPGSKMCGCGMNRTCQDHHLDCNCDIGDRQWREDDGYLTDKDSLPVTMLQFSVEATNASSFFTVGRLECFGSAPLLTTVPPSTVKVNMTSPTTAMRTLKYDGDGARISLPQLSTLFMTTNATMLNNSMKTGGIRREEGVDDIFPTPYLITIVAIGTVLCLLLIILVIVLFKAKISGFLYRQRVSKPHIEIEEYDRCSSVMSSEWDFHVTTSFPTSTPDDSTTMSDEELRTRTLEDMRDRRRFLKIGGWPGRTASAPTITGRTRSSRSSLSDQRPNSRQSAMTEIPQTHTKGEASSSQAYETSSDSSKQSFKSSSDVTTSGTCCSLDLEQGSATGTTSDNESSRGSTKSLSTDDSYPSVERKHYSKRKGSASRDLPLGETHAPPSYRGVRPIDARLYENTGFQVCDARPNNTLTVPCNNTHRCAENVKLCYQNIPVNNCGHRYFLRRVPPQYNHPPPDFTHRLGAYNSLGRCHFVNPASRYVPQNKRPFSEIPSFLHPTIQEVDCREEEDAERSGLAEQNDNDIYSVRRKPSSSQDEAEEGDAEHLALLKKRVIQKATNICSDLET